MSSAWPHVRPVPTCVAVRKSVPPVPPRRRLLYAPVVGLISQRVSRLSSATQRELSPPDVSEPLDVAGVGRCARERVRRDGLGEAQLRVLGVRERLRGSRRRRPGSRFPDRRQHRVRTVAAEPRLTFLPYAPTFALPTRRAKWGILHPSCPVWCPSLGESVRATWPRSVPAHHRPQRRSNRASPDPPVPTAPSLVPRPTLPPDPDRQRVCGPDSRVPVRARDVGGRLSRTVRSADKRESVFLCSLTTMRDMNYVSCVMHRAHALPPRGAL